MLAFLPSLRLVLLFTAASSVALTSFARSATASTSQKDAQADFFERRVRPVLVTRCLECHGPAKQEGGLRLDARAHVLAGGASGAVIVPGDAAASRLMAAIRRQGDPKMPPDRPLSAGEIAALERWIQAGAFWPEQATLAATKIDSEALADHWAFQPVQDPPAPLTRDHSWARSSIDPFVLAKLESNDLTPSPAAGRRTLVRRLTFDLLGLPPSYDEVQTFAADTSPDAYVKLVDRLLASPRYGERWGRLWLDVARYADTKGYAYFQDLNYPYAYSYRDYVVGAFNQDLPYDEFVTQQIAADLLPPAQYARSAAALGFLTVGQRFMNNLHDVVDDRIDVVTRGLMGLTVACARCHDHKYDPIPTADYYSLYGVFRSASEPLVGPAVEPRPATEEYEAYERELDKRVNALTEFATKKHAELVAGAKARAAEYLLAAQRDEDSGVQMDEFMIVVDPGDLNPTMTLRWQALLRRTRPLNDPVLSPWHAFAALPEEGFAAEARRLSARLATTAGERSGAPAAGDAEADAKRQPTDSQVQRAPAGAALVHNAAPKAPPRVNSLVAAAFAKSPPRSLKDAANVYGELLAETDAMWQTASKAAAPDSPPESLPDPAREELRQLLYAPGAPANIPLPDIGFNLVRFLPDRDAQEIVKKLLKDVEDWAAKGKNMAPRAMVLVDTPVPHEPRIFHRGNPAQPRQAVPRQFLGALAGEHRKSFRMGSGRLELARAIVDAKNPLTARVLVNRVWMHHFGVPLVATPSDFGLRSGRPLHLELLDHLASRLMEDGWSIKRLHRRILLSATYRQASEHRVDAATIDAENNLLWRQNRRRLSFEGVRDSLLDAAGDLDRRLGGPSVKLLSRPFPKRRAVYGFVDRGDLPGLLSAFDFPSPDATSARRPETTVPQQTLFFMNHHFVVECAASLLRRARAGAERSESDVVRELYRIVFARQPRAEELEAAYNFVETTAAPHQDYADWTYGYGELERDTGHLTDFHLLPRWSGVDWRLGENTGKDSDRDGLSVIRLDVTGGHTAPAPGPTPVRRWTARRAVNVRIQGRLSHVAKKEKVKEGNDEVEKTLGDGVCARLILNGRQEISRWSVHGDDIKTTAAITQLAAGATLDFVVDGVGDASDDQFEWEVKIFPVDADSRTSDTPRWDSRLDFRGPQAKPWEQLAQALLMANEFVFVD